MRAGGATPHQLDRLRQAGEVLDPVVRHEAADRSVVPGIIPAAGRRCARVAPMQRDGDRLRGRDIREGPTQPARDRVNQKPDGMLTSMSLIRMRWRQSLLCEVLPSPCL